MKRATLFLALLGAILLAGCGSRDTTSQTTFNNGSGNQPFKPITHLNHRSLVTNSQAGLIQVMDTTYDRLTSYTFAAGTDATYMQPSHDGTLSFVYNTGGVYGPGTITSLNNSLEAVKGTVSLGGWTESFVTSNDNKTGFAAVYNYSNGDLIAPGAVARFNPTDGSLTTPFVPFPNVRYISMDTAEKHLLAFKDVQDNIASSGNPVDNEFVAYWVDLTMNDSKTQLPIISAISLPPGTLSVPVDAFFGASSSNTSGATVTYTTKAYVLNCGQGCGGTGTPNVTELDITETQTTDSTKTPPVTTATTTATIGPQWFVSGVRRGYMDSKANKLYVAGSSGTPVTDAGGNTVQDGSFSVIDLSAGTSKTIPIGNGQKRWIRNVNGAFWVASLNCGVESCISIVDSAASTFSQPKSVPRGDATGVSFSANSGEVYTIEGGELYIYDQSGNPVTSEYNTDVKGQASDVLYIN